MDAPELYRVVINNEEQYSLLPVGISNPPGWKDAGLIDSCEACLAYVRERWTDMRPLSVRRLPNPVDDSHA